MSVDLWGVTRNPQSDEHHVRLTVNGTVLTEARFDDLESFTPERRGPGRPGRRRPQHDLRVADRRHRSVRDGGRHRRVAHRPRPCERPRRRVVRRAAVARAVRVAATAPVAAYRVVSRNHVARAATLTVDGGVLLAGRARVMRYLVADDEAGLVRPSSPPIVRLRLSSVAGPTTS